VVIDMVTRPNAIKSVQHEYGIFGGKAGADLLGLLRELRMPIVTTLHTILSAPNPSQRMVLEELAWLHLRPRAPERGARRARALEEFGGDRPGSHCAGER
jgi:hypothetical protein